MEDFFYFTALSRFSCFMLRYFKLVRCLLFGKKGIHIPRILWKAIYIQSQLES
jgi:hypothetical protein